MEQLLERFSLYDFFNLIFCGGAFLIGLHMFGVSVISLMLDSIGIAQSEMLVLLAVLLACYVVGFFLQAVDSFMSHRPGSMQEHAVSTVLFDEGGVVRNKEKLRTYQVKARELFRSKGIELSESGFSGSQCEYFFAYCSYVVQLDSRCKKVEKMRALKGLSSLWALCFGLLSIMGCAIGIACSLAYGAIGADSIRYFLMASVSLLFALVCCYKKRENTLFWIRMVLAMYEIVDDERLRSDLYSLRRDSQGR